MSGYICSTCAMRVPSVGPGHVCRHWYPVVTTAGRVPHRCPVCEGRGHVPAGFYVGKGSATSANPEGCRSCNGTGILWA